MSDLSGKFVALEQASAARHTELMNALNAISTALGAPPPTATTTLADVVARLNSLVTNTSTTNVKLGQMYIADQERGDDVQASLSGIAALLTTIRDKQNNIHDRLGNAIQYLVYINDGANANTRMILSALATLDPCKDCNEGIGEKPAPDTDISPQDQEQCKRMQLLLACVARLVDKFDRLINAGIYPTPANIISAAKSLEQVLSLPNIIIPSYLEVSRVIMYLSSLSVQRLLGNESQYLADALDTLHSQLLAALYSANSAEAGLAAYEIVISGSGLSAYIKNCLISSGYVALFNYCYGRGNNINLGGIDGTICVEQPTEPMCYTLQPIQVSVIYPLGTNPPSHTRYAAAIPEILTGVSTFNSPDGGTYTYSNAISATSSNMHNWTVRKVSGGVVRVWAVTAGNSWYVHEVTSEAFIIPVDTVIFGIDNWYSNDVSPGDPFVAELCRPGSSSGGGF